MDSRFRDVEKIAGLERRFSREKLNRDKRKLGWIDF